MGQSIQGKEEGEQIFEVYLRENNFLREYEPALGPGKRPDYLVHVETGDILCEVKDFGEAAIDRKLQSERQPMRLSDGTVVGAIVSGSWDPLPRIRDRILKAAKQLRPFKGKYPCSVILYNPGYMTDLGDFTVISAIFSHKDRLLSPEKNTTISAVAVLEIFRPHLFILHEAAAKQAEEDRKNGVPSDKRIENSLRACEETRQKYPSGYFDEAHPRLRVYHNPFAACPLPLTTFRGPYDEQTWQDPESGETKTKGVKKRRSAESFVFKRHRGS